MNKTENSENLVKKMFLSISVMSCFAVSDLENASAMNNVNPVNNIRNSIFGDVNKGRSDNKGRRNTALLSAPSAPMATLAAKQDNSGYRLAAPDSSISDQKTNTGAEGGSLILKDLGDKNKSSESDSSNSSSSSFDETMNVSFSLTVPEPTKEALASSKINAKKDKDVLLFLNSVASMNDIPLCMYNVLISRIDDFFYTRIPLNDKVIRTILRIWGVDHKILSEPEDSIPIILRSIREILSEVLLRR